MDWKPEYAKKTTTLAANMPPSAPSDRLKETLARPRCGLVNAA